jgi:hypothetical protein
MLFTGGADPEPGLLPDPRSGQRSQQWSESRDQRDGRLQESHTSQVYRNKHSRGSQSVTKSTNVVLMGENF